METIVTLDPNVQGLLGTSPEGTALLLPMNPPHDALGLLPICRPKSRIDDYQLVDIFT